MNDTSRSAVVAQWIEKAEEDLRAAEHLLTLGRDCPFGLVCFHAQQSAEKYLKAILVHYGREFTKIHDIGRLVRALPSPSVVDLSTDQQARLTDYASAGRYPGEDEPFEHDEASEAIEMAKRVREAIHPLISPGS